MADSTPDWAAPLGRVPSGLYILTARQGNEETGMLASWVMQCSFDPPRVSVAVQPDRRVYDWLREGAIFTLNILAEGQSALLRHFAKGFEAGQPVFEGINTEQTAEGSVILTEALGHLVCQVANRCPAGDHDLILGTILAGRMHQTDAKPMTHVRKNGLRY
jgi:flavin reductase (DIM6/NTAB) family NADH-FMN oxidoreductase RutF